MNLFVNNANCVACHDGPLFSKATTFQSDNPFETIERMPLAESTTSLYDNGFYNIGVRPTFEDRGVGSVDAYGNPLSSSSSPAAATACRVPPAAQTMQQRIAVDGSMNRHGNTENWSRPTLVVPGASTNCRVNVQGAEPAQRRPDATVFSQRRTEVADRRGGVLQPWR
jgi:hypothetical protein